MAEIPQQRLLVEQEIEDNLVYQVPRTYLGYSQIGHECTRFVLFTFRWVYHRSHPQRIQRLFDRGKYEEEVIANELTEIGCKVEDDQKELIGFAGHVKGHIDGTVINLPDSPKTKHLLENKTAKEKFFKEFLKAYDIFQNHSAISKIHRAYWWQIHAYMGKMHLRRCLFTVTNKNDEERLYFRIKFDKSVYDLVLRAEIDIVTAVRLFDRIGNNSPTWFECKTCAASDQCFGIKPVNKNCRTCEYSSIEDGGVWACDHKMHKIPSMTAKQQWDGCKDYKMEEMFACLV